jgi:hypothetical protein
MLNLNFNIIGSTNLSGTQPFRAGAVYSVRNDPFSASIVLAMPGNLFYDGDYQNQFGMSYAWDDISAYVKGNGVPVGSNLTVNASTTGSGTITTSSLTNFAGASSKYNNSTRLDSTSSLVVPNTFAAKSGSNLSFTSSFIVEAYAAWETTGSATISDFNPKREFVYKYDPSLTSSAFAWYGNYGGQPVPLGGDIISGSTMFFWTKDNAGNEIKVSGTGSNAIVPYQFKHYAVSYTAVDAVDPGLNRRLRLYIDGVLQTEYTVATNTNMNQDPAEALNVFGRYDTDTPDYAGNSPMYFNDFRFYNGTNKNYTGSLIPLPESMVVWQ